MKFFDMVYWENSVGTYILAGAVALGALFLAWIASAVIKRKFIRHYEETETRVDDMVADVGGTVVFLLLFLAGLHAAVRVLQLAPWLERIVFAAFMVSWTVLGTLFVSRLLRGLLTHYVQRHATRTESKLDDQLIPVFRTVINVGLWVVAVLFLLSNLGFQIGSILAGLGLGGLALAMASKDLLANVFGAFTILFQGPFRVGDAVKYQGHSGKIELVGMRATQIRTWAGHLVTVPNALATTSVVENISNRPSFRVLFNLGLEYGISTAQIDLASKRIGQAIEEEEGTKAGPSIHFLEFGDSALVFQVLYYVLDQDRALDIRHNINRRIKAKLEAEGIGFAYPTITVNKVA